MEHANNNRLEELFGKARNEKPKTSFETTKEQFLKAIQTGNTTIKGNGKGIAHFFNLKNGIIMITTITAITIGTLLLVNGSNRSAEPVVTKQSESTEKTIPKQQEAFVAEEHTKTVQAHMEKVELLPTNFRSLYEVKAELALKIQDQPMDSLKRYLKALEHSKRNNTFMLDTSYRFPKLNAEEVKANNKQKEKMLRYLARWKRKMPAYNNIDQREYRYIPPMKYKGKTINAFQMLNHEVTNLEYRTFLFDLLIQNKKEEFLKAKPDQSRWVKDFSKSYGKPMQTHYFSHAAYDKYPVVGISRVGAEMYCEWLTEERNKMNPKQFEKMVNKVRLPMAIEWMVAASGGLESASYPWGGDDLLTSDGNYLANFLPKRDTSAKIINEEKYEYCYKCDGAFHTARVKLYPPNPYGLYDMSGNVAEMVYYIDENYAPGTKGGSWTSIGEELKINGKDRFKGVTSPSVDIGFRPVISYISSSIEQIKAVVGPPGIETAYIGSRVFMDKTEITNFQWKEYVNWNIKTYGKNSKAHQESLPDTSVWEGMEAFEEVYFNHPAYDGYPVVGVSYEQVMAFCQWRTDRLKETFNQQLDKNKNIPKKFVYRLPTKKEWEKVANAYYAAKNKKEEALKYKSNVKTPTTEMGSVATDNAAVTAPSKSYLPNTFGVYNMIGNVAEMIDEKGIAKGGSWKHTLEESAIENNINYKKANNWVGFRCVFEVLD